VLTSTIRRVNQIRCSQCGTVDLEPGFVTDSGQGARGYTQWIAGLLETGILGIARIRGRRRETVSAFRCPQCGHLELFASP
jgi:DNA-directed RNA polymerase subunit RPC12/RpoP